MTFPFNTPRVSNRSLTSTRKAEFAAAALAGLTGIFLTGAALAETKDMPDYNPETLDSCLDSKTGREERASCIGAASDECMSDAKGQTTVGMVQCLSLETESWDSKLNQTYKTLMAEQVAADKSLRDLGSAQPAEREAKLRSMQKAWITYRDSACAFDAAQWDGGSGSGPSAATCMLELTGQQALYLESFLQANRN